jgi:putative addiction module killer protein
MATIRESDYFAEWLEGIDNSHQGRIARRIKRAEDGNFGECEYVGDGITEMKLHFGPGYRLYFCQSSPNLYLLLIGGDKDTQQSDIKRAKDIKKEAEEMNKW